MIASSPRTPNHHHDNEQQPHTINTPLNIPNKNLVFKTAQITDIPALQQCQRITYLATYPEIAAEHPDVMKTFLEETYATEKILEEINDPNITYYIIVDNDIPEDDFANHCVAFVKVCRGAAQTWETFRQCDDVLQIKRIYVRVEYHGLQLGRVLLDGAIAHAKAIMANKIWLGVYDKNEKAIHFYKKNGFFKIPAETTFKMVHRIYTNHIMVLDLKQHSIMKNNCIAKL